MTESFQDRLRNELNVRRNENLYRETRVFDGTILNLSANDYFQLRHNQEVLVAASEIARIYGAEVPGLRPAEYASEKSPDIEWVCHLLKLLVKEYRLTDAFSLLRPTSPFRRPETICKAWEAFKSTSGVDSLRAVEKCSQHPGKMWVIREGYLLPILPFGNPPWHSSQYQTLPEVFVQNASLEIAWSKVPLENDTIAGSTIMPWISEKYDGFDINTKEDWITSERLLESGAISISLEIENFLKSHS